MKRPYQITSVVLILFSAFVVRESLDMVYYTPLGPGAGFFPFWIGVIVGGLAAIMLFQATFQRSDPMPEGFFPTRIGYMRVGSVTLAVVGVVALMIPVGFRLTMLFFLVFLLFALGRQNWLVTALVSLAGSFGAFYIFEKWLQVPLPVGMLGI